MRLDDAYELLKRSHENGRLAQGYIINGPVTGAGLELVNRLLSLVFCQSSGGGCGECPGCRGAREHTHPDLGWVEPQKKSRMISVEQVRGFQRQMFQTSFEGGWKVCVIRFADRLGIEASNAFLKMLEEPPGKALFILLTDSPHGLLPTIRSRCQFVTVDGASDLLPVSWRGALAGILNHLGARDTVTSFSLAGQLIRLLEEMKESAMVEIEKAAEAETLEEDDETLEARGMARYRELRSGLFRYMVLWYRDMLMVTCGADPVVMAIPEHEADIRQKAEALDPRGARGNIDVIEQMHRQLEQNVPESLAIGVGIGKLHT